MNPLRTTARRFSLFELIVVMSLLTVLAAVVAPRLTGFFRGQRMDDEARRLWALTRYAREQAIARAVPVELWLDPETRQYGVDALPGYGFAIESKAYAIGEAVSIDVEPASIAGTGGDLSLVWWPDGSLADGSATAWIVFDARNESDGWRIARQGLFPTYTLSRGIGP